jgi:hypothetical protein
MLVRNLLVNCVLHPHNMTQVLQPPLLYLRNEFELFIEFVDLTDSHALKITVTAVHVKISVSSLAVSWQWILTLSSANVLTGW